MLNTDEVADLAKQTWGDILHPTITDIVLMVVGLVRDSPGLSMDDVDMWKTDLRGAYTLMSFKASNCMKFAVELVNGVTNLPVRAFRLVVDSRCLPGHH